MTNKYNLDSLGIFDEKVQKILFPKNIAEGEIVQYPIEEGLTLQKFDLVPKIDFVLESTDINQPLIVCNIFLKGKIHYHNKKFKIKKDFKENLFTTLALNEDTGLSYYKKGVHVKTFNLVMNYNFLEKISLKSSINTKLIQLLEKLQKKPIFEILDESYFRHDILTNLEKMENMYFEDNLEKFYIQSQVYELVYASISSIKKEHRCLLKEDIMYIQAVEEYIMKNIDENFTLEKLARIGKTNKNKLQNNFKAYYQKTVFEFIIDCRMLKAKELLKSSDYTIDEIAKKVGYKYQSNFSSAFFKRFGILPRSLLKNRSYYWL
jgi:AraC-like DNA-binding protein